MGLLIYCGRKFLFSAALNWLGAALICGSPSRSSTTSRQLQSPVYISCRSATVSTQGTSTTLFETTAGFSASISRLFPCAPSFCEAICPYDILISRIPAFSSEPYHGTPAVMSSLLVDHARSSTPCKRRTPRFQKLLCVLRSMQLHEDMDAGGVGTQGAPPPGTIQLYYQCQHGGWGLYRGTSLAIDVYRKRIPCAERRHWVPFYSEAMEIYVH